MNIPHGNFGLKIVYIGSLNGHSNSYRRFISLGLMGQEVKGIDTDIYIYGNIFEKFHHHLNIGPGIKRLNKKVVEEILESPPDILWVDNRSFLTVVTLKRIKMKWPTIKIINLITDDPFGSQKVAWRLCHITASYFDCHFVQRSMNVGELKALGAKKVELCYRSFDPSFHKRLILDTADKAKFHTNAGFIGTYEKEREEFIVHLIRNKIKLKVVGDGWPKGRHWNIIKPYYAGPSVYSNEYVKIINGMDIALHFLRRANRDEQDSRTFEIPACGAFMLAERSKVHEGLFKENEEAVFFDTKEELLEKVQYYLEHSELRSAIADRGYRRSVESGYDHMSTLKRVIQKI